MDCWSGREVADHSLLSKAEAGLCLDRDVGVPATCMARLPVFTRVNTCAHACMYDSSLCKGYVNVCLWRRLKATEASWLGSQGRQGRNVSLLTFQRGFDHYSGLCG